jgi:endonuclease-3 related protein
VNEERRLRQLYGVLLKAYGPQGWWPITSLAGAEGFDGRGYHPGDRRPPRPPAQRFEIILGAVLTQNTAWTNAELALRRLRAEGVRTPRSVLRTDPRTLASWIRPSGYYNQKERKLRGLASVFAARGALSGQGSPSRGRLLSTWGIGEETADSILLYAFGRPHFVVDAYTRRLLGRLGLPAGTETYAELQAAFHRALPEDPEIFNEYHALIVEHAKVRCRARPLCRGCPVRFCPFNPDGPAPRPAKPRRSGPAA